MPLGLEQLRVICGLKARAVVLPRLGGRVTGQVTVLLWASWLVSQLARGDQARLGSTPRRSDYSCYQGAAVSLSCFPGTWGTGFTLCRARPRLAPRVCSRWWEPRLREAETCPWSHTVGPEQRWVWDGASGCSVPGHPTGLWPPRWPLSSASLTWLGFGCVLSGGAELAGEGDAVLRRPPSQASGLRLLVPRPRGTSRPPASRTSPGLALSRPAPPAPTWPVASPGLGPTRLPAPEWRWTP